MENFFSFTVLCACLILVTADPERPRKYLEHDRTVINCARYKREANQHSCVLSPFIMEGPFFLTDDLERSNITDDQLGVPYDLTIRLVNANDCTPLTGMFVHVWHSSATGGYSGFDSSYAQTQDGTPGNGGSGGQGFNNQGGFGGQGFNNQGGFGGQGFNNQGGQGFNNQGGFGGQGFNSQGGFGEQGFNNQGGFGNQQFGGRPDSQGGNGNQQDDEVGMLMRHEPENDQRYLRGYQVSNEDGEVNFKTILPGWYAGRCTHVHVEVYPRNTTDASDISYVGQIFFRSDLPSILKPFYPYSINTNPVMSNEEDSTFGDRGNEMITTLEPLDGSGYKSSMTLGINPNA